MMSEDKLLTEAMSLPVELRVILINKLLESLNQIQPDIDSAWAKEADERVKEIETGKVSTIPGDELYKEIRDTYNL